MTPNRVTVAMEKYGTQIPPGNSASFRSYLEEADDRCMDEFMFLPIRKKGVTLALSLFFGHLGFDRFYLGHKKKGILKLGATIVSSILLNSGSGASTSMAILVAIALYAWIFIDIFKCYKDARISNYFNLVGYLDRHHYKELSSAPAPSATPAASSMPRNANGTFAKKTAPAAKAPVKSTSPAVTAPKAVKPAKAASVKTAPVIEPTLDIEDAMNAYLSGSQSSVEDLVAAKNAAEIAALYNAPDDTPDAEESKSNSGKIDLTFSKIKVNPRLAKDLGFEDFDTSSIGGNRRGR